MNGKDEEVKKKLKLMAAAGNHHIWSGGRPNFGKKNSLFSRRSA